MPIVKEFRIPMPVTAEEYQVAQIYMTARAQSMEAEQEDGAGVEVVESYATTHPKLGKGWFTKKHYHIDRRFPAWLRMVAPKSGTMLIEESYNCFPNTLTTLTLPLFSKFKITVQSTHKNDNGKSENVHGLSPEALKKREVIFLNIAERSEEEKKKKMYDKDTADPSTWTSKRTGRGPLKKGWQDTQQPIMTAYKLVTAEFDYWPIGGRIEEFVHSYEGGVFLSANRQMTCWMDEWHGLSMDDVRRYEDDATARVNQITAIKEGRQKGRIQDLPEAKPVRSSEGARAATSSAPSAPTPASAPLAIPQPKPPQPQPAPPGPPPSAAPLSPPSAPTSPESRPAPSAPAPARSPSKSKNNPAPTAPSATAPKEQSRDLLLQTAVPEPEQYQQARAVPTEVPQLLQAAAPEPEQYQQAQEVPQLLQAAVPERTPYQQARAVPQQQYQPPTPKGEAREEAKEGQSMDAPAGFAQTPDMDQQPWQQEREPDMGQQEMGMGYREEANEREDQQQNQEEVGRGYGEEGGGQGGKVGVGPQSPLQSPFGEWGRLQVPKFDMPSMPELLFFPQSPKLIHTPSKRTRDHQRDPLPGDPVCTAPRCGKYGQYTMVDSGAVVCSIQCKLALSAHNSPSSMRLPRGWEQRVTAEGKAFYIDHNTSRTQWAPPMPHTR